MTIKKIGFFNFSNYWVDVDKKVAGFLNGTRVICLKGEHCGKRATFIGKCVEENGDPVFIFDEDEGVACTWPVENINEIRSLTEEELREESSPDHSI